MPIVYEAIKLLAGGDCCVITAGPGDWLRVDYKSGSHHNQWMINRSELVDFLRLTEPKKGS